LITFIPFKTGSLTTGWTRRWCEFRSVCNFKENCWFSSDLYTSFMFVIYYLMYKRRCVPWIYCLLWLVIALYLWG